MTKYAWIIDAAEDEPSIIGPSDAPEDLQDRLVDGKGLHFRLYDDDDELCLKGRLISVNADTMAGNYSEEAFGPLDDFGAPAYGCTRIDYLHPKTEQWETL
ncbi:hypothetical protein [Magnetospirillum molischianum]|uniref:Uncharacterized protein n=1 Tax=Magnetospirillum molischianum DSM 120 TaxID=1150626 RepID=H8FXZ1_MAGML|nr:hypothetical protein [Magnetospirillum molischianum]CCG43229.1 conserved hypothetical protein [Magnetospirillum molischianum DSM 120]